MRAARQKTRPVACASALHLGKLFTMKLKRSAWYKRKQLRYS